MSSEVAPHQRSRPKSRSKIRPKHKPNPTVREPTSAPPREMARSTPPSGGTGTVSTDPSGSKKRKRPSGSVVAVLSPVAPIGPLTAPADTGRSGRADATGGRQDTPTHRASHDRSKELHQSSNHVEHGLVMISQSSGAIAEQNSSEGKVLERGSKQKKKMRKRLGAKVIAANATQATKTATQPERGSGPVAMTPPQKQAPLLPHTRPPVVHAPGHPSIAQSPGGLTPHATGSKKKSKKRQRTEGPLRHNFTADYLDHFETPLQAYQDIAPVLEALAGKLGKNRSQLRIWDPYYCAGRTPRLLGQLGFTNVHHNNQDFYRVVAEGAEPEHDVLVTNPAYSADHKQRCLAYCAGSGKPWLLLIPNYIATKDYYRTLVLGGPPPAASAGQGQRNSYKASHGAKTPAPRAVEPFYVVPDVPYEFDHPEGTGHETPPFLGVWFVHLGAVTREVFQSVPRQAGVRLISSVAGLVSGAVISCERRLNPKQRKAARKRLMKQAASTGL